MLAYLQLVFLQHFLSAYLTVYSPRSPSPMTSNPLSHPFVTVFQAASYTVTLIVDVVYVLIEISVGVDTNTTTTTTMITTTTTVSKKIHAVRLGVPPASSTRWVGWWLERAQYRTRLDYSSPSSLATDSFFGSGLFLSRRNLPPISTQITSHPRHPTKIHSTMWQRLILYSRYVHISTLYYCTCTISPESWEPIVSTRS